MKNILFNTVAADSDMRLRKTFAFPQLAIIISLNLENMVT